MPHNDYNKLLIKYSTEFNKIKSNALYPITGFYSVFLDENTEPTLNLRDIDVDSYNSDDKLLNILTGSTYGRSILRVIPCIRIQNSYQFNLVVQDKTISHYSYIMMLYIDNTKVSKNDSINDFVNLDKKYYKYLRIAAIIDGAKQLILDNSNIFTINDIHCDLKKLIPYERDFIEHLDQYNVDKRNVEDKSVSSDQFLIKTSGLDFLGEKIMDQSRLYNCPRLNTSGRIEY